MSRRFMWAIHHRLTLLGNRRMLALPAGILASPNASKIDLLLLRQK